MGEKMSKKNLDLECAKVGKKIVEERKEDADKKIKNVVENSLGVLQEDGIYAFYVYLFSEGAQNEKNNSYVIAKRTWNFLKEGDNDEFGMDFVEKDFNKNRVYKDLENKVLNDLDRTFFVKEILENILVYGRYHAKALKGLEEDEE